METGFVHRASPSFTAERAFEFARFCIVGASGYLVNLSVYASVLALGMHFRAAAGVSFAVAVVSNYLLHRSWTFRSTSQALGLRGSRFLAVSLAGLGVNELWLSGFVSLGVEKVSAQAAAAILVMPLSFLGNRLWAVAT